MCRQQRKQVKGTDGEEAANKHFVNVQEAYDTLMDPVKRRKFDSSLPFDDAIPKYHLLNFVT